MILVLSSNEDYSTNEVLHWLKNFQAPFLRSNKIDLLTLDSTIFQSNKLENEKYIFDKINDINNYSSIWVRRGGFSFSFPQINEAPEKNQYILNHCNSEFNSLINHINNVFDEKKSLGSLNYFDINKLDSLRTAKKIGLRIPDTIVTTNKKSLCDFFCLHDQAITKNIQDILIYNNQDDFYFTYTELVTSQILDLIPEVFPPSLFQEKIDKEFEIRSFYLDGKFFSMAIFSQNDSQTEIDFRKYNNQIPNRTTPFKLPEKIEQMLHKFMKQINLNTGSFDLIYSKNKEFVFLEVNPIGQYDNVSKGCNFHLDKEIAEYLTNKTS